MELMSDEYKLLLSLLRAEIDDLEAWSKRYSVDGYYKERKALCERIEDKILVAELKL